MTTCTICQLHAESIFRIEGMDCHQEVAILRRRLTRLAVVEDLEPHKLVDVSGGEGGLIELHPELLHTDGSDVDHGSCLTV